MSILRSILDSVRSSFSNEAYEQVALRELQNKIREGVHEASSDGTITAEEIAEIKTMAEKLELTETDMNHIKLEVLRDLIKHILADQKVTEQEMALYKEVEDGLNFEEGETDQLKADIEKVKELFEKS